MFFEFAKKHCPILRLPDRPKSKNRFKYRGHERIASRYNCTIDVKSILAPFCQRRRILRLGLSEAKSYANGSQPATRAG